LFLHSDLFESFAWASAQVHCQCTTNSKIILSEKINTTARSVAINASMNSEKITWSFLLYLYAIFIYIAFGCNLLNVINALKHLIGQSE